MTPNRFYVSCAQSREILAYSLADDGTLTLDQRVATGDSPLPLYVCPRNRVLYVGMRETSALAAYAIAPGDGALTLLGRAPASGRAAYVSCDRERRLAFEASYGDDRLEVFPLDRDGAPLAASQVETGLPHAHAALADASNRWLIVPLLGADEIRTYRLSGTGIDLHAVYKARAGCGPRVPLWVGGQLVCLNELDGSIDRYAFDSERGELAVQQSISLLPAGFADKPWSAELRTRPDGRFLYATDRRASTIAVLAVDPASGHLGLVEHVATEPQPRGMGISRCGRWLVAAGQLSHRLSVYAIDAASGRLSLTGSQATGQDPICVEFAGNAA